MNHTHHLSEQIADKLAAVERKMARLRERLHALEAKKNRLKMAQSVLLEFLGERQPESDQPSCTQPELGRHAGRRRHFHSEGQTAMLVRYLYANRRGATVIEAAQHAGVPTRRTRTAFDRLCNGGLLTRSGSHYALTQNGKAAWEASPLFGRGGYGNQTQPAVQLATSTDKIIEEASVHP
jgi:hypothetical protein